MDKPGSIKRISPQGRQKRSKIDDDDDDDEMMMMMMVLIGKLGITMNNKWAGEIMEYIVGWRWLYACPVTGNRIDQTSMAGDQY